MLLFFLLKNVFNDLKVSHSLLKAPGKMQNSRTEEDCPGEFCIVSFVTLGTLILEGKARGQELVSFIFAPCELTTELGTRWASTCVLSCTQNRGDTRSQRKWNPKWVLKEQGGLERLGTEEASGDHVL